MKQQPPTARRLKKVAKDCPGTKRVGILDNASNENDEGGAGAFA
jgi:hypothetical protein